MAALAAMVCAFVVGIQPAASQPNDNEKKVRICHATSAETNPYIENEPAIANNGDLNGGHLDHKGSVFPAADWGDIIPPYDYVDDKGVTRDLPRLQLDAAGAGDLGERLRGRPESRSYRCSSASTPRRAAGSWRTSATRTQTRDPVVVPFENTFVPDPANRGQPTVFQPGRVNDAFQAASTRVGVDVEADRQPGHGLTRLEAVVSGLDHDRQGSPSEQRSRGVSTSRSTASPQAAPQLSVTAARPARWP